MGLTSQTIDLDLLGLNETETITLPFRLAKNGMKNATFEVVWNNMTIDYAGSTITVANGLSAEALAVSADITAGALNYTIGALEVITNTQAKASGFGSLVITVKKGTGVTTAGGVVTIGVLYDGDATVTKPEFL